MPPDTILSRDRLFLEDESFTSVEANARANLSVRNKHTTTDEHAAAIILERFCGAFHAESPVSAVDFVNVQRHQTSTDSLSRAEKRRCDGIPVDFYRRSLADEDDSA
ncbi:MAG: hypothetical protein MHM6MM_004943 [Cercozoa sp. M6MM]